jgi:hypothetical protein
MHLYYDIDGNPISVEKWMKLRNEWGQISQEIAQTERGDVLVSTVFMGLNLNPGIHPPLIFETMIFGGEHDQFTQRYASLADAVLGHEEAIKLAFGEES